MYIKEIDDRTEEAYGTSFSLLTELIIMNRLVVLLLVAVAVATFAAPSEGAVVSRQKRSYYCRFYSCPFSCWRGCYCKCTSWGWPPQCRWSVCFRGTSEHKAIRGLKSSCLKFTNNMNRLVILLLVAVAITMFAVPNEGAAVSRQKRTLYCPRKPGWCSYWCRFGCFCQCTYRVMPARCYWRCK
ncbi:hypothetical protein ACROYT_G024685 [Oculina patagonica]